MSGGEHLRDGEGAGAYRTVSGEGGDVTTGAEWLTSPENNLQPRLPYDLQLEKDAVYQVLAQPSLQKWPPFAPCSVLQQAFLF